MYRDMARKPCLWLAMGLALVLLVAVWPQTAPAQTLEMNTSVVSAGGAPGTGGVFRLNGTVGQGSGIGRLSGGQFNEHMGFWYAILPEVTPGSIDTLTIALTTSTSALLTWTSDRYADEYRVFRDSFAYFDATGAPWTVVNPPDTILTVTNGIGNTSTNYSYRVRAWSTGGSGPASNTVGEHDFSSTGTLLKPNRPHAGVHRDGERSTR